MKTSKLCQIRTSPANIYLFKVNNRSSRKRCDICSKLTDVVLVFSLLTLNLLDTFFYCSIFDFEQVNVSWVMCFVLCTIFGEMQRRIQNPFKLVGWVIS